MAMGAGLALGGVMATGGFFSGKQANKQSKKAARELMRWQEKMANTAHQREVKDLIKAGLNPVLSANGGASTPSGAMPDIQPINPLGDAAEGFERGANAGRAISRVSSEIDAMKAAAEASRAAAASSAATAAQTNYKTNVMGPKEIEEMDSRIKANIATSAQTVANTDLTKVKKQAEELGLPEKKTKEMIHTTGQKFYDWVTDPAGWSSDLTKMKTNLYDIPRRDAARWLNNVQNSAKSVINANHGSGRGGSTSRSSK